MRRVRRVIGCRAHRSVSTCEARTEKHMVVPRERAMQSARFCRKGWALAFSFFAGGCRGAFSFHLQVRVWFSQRLVHQSHLSRLTCNCLVFRLVGSRVPCPYPCPIPFSSLLCAACRSARISQCVGACSGEGMTQQRRGEAMTQHPLSPLTLLPSPLLSSFLWQIAGDA